jgi:S-DNA-T family DNA segregation ATPase FtsK/SpoIIIE
MSENATEYHREKELPEVLQPHWQEWKTELTELQQASGQRLIRAVDRCRIWTGEFEAEPEPAPAEGNISVAEPEPTATVPAVESEEEDAIDYGGYQKPPLSLLAEPAEWDQRKIDPEAIDRQRRALQDTLDSFKVDATVMDAIIGPRVTQFRIRPAAGVRVEAIESLEKNLSLALAVGGLRIEAPIPGEPFVGIEFPNGNEAPIRLRNVFESNSWRQSDASLPLVVGVDINGRNQILDLAKAPHLLIAGATGSGKSVCMNNFILSLLYRFRPDELELVLIDPKQVEFAPYKELPHLIHPVASDPKQVARILQWVVREMESRYTRMAEKRVRHVLSYNAKAKEQGFMPMPFMVVIIDELADLMMLARDKVENSLARLAQLSRAVGIHTILATQRPSVNVITGVIKANYPCRIAFRVSSGIDSRTILDANGSETLQGRGDMLFSPPGAYRLIRAQSPMVEDPEIEACVDFLKEQSPPHYRVELPSEEETDESGADVEGDDPLIRQALEIIVNHNRATTSFLQRKLKIGYNRAARLMEELEARGHIGEQVGAQPREILTEREF